MLKKHISQNTVFSSRFKENRSSLTPRQSLSKIKETLKYGHSQLCVLQNKDRVKNEYFVQNGRGTRKLPIQKSDVRQRSNIRSNGIINVNFQNQLKEAIKNLSQTLTHCQYLRKEENDPVESKQNHPPLSFIQSKNFSLIEQNSFSSQNILQLVHLQQRIKNRQSQINSIEMEISKLKQENCCINKQSTIQIQKLMDFENFLLAEELKQMDQILKQYQSTYQKKIQKLQIMKIKIINAFKEAYRLYKSKVNNSQKDKTLLIEQPLTYSEFKKRMLNKRKQNQQEKYLQKVKSMSYISPNLKQYSNISNVSFIIPYSSINHSIDRDSSHSEIPQLPKQKNPTIKSLNYKKKVFKDAFQTQRVKHENKMTELIDKLLFLHDEELCLSEQIENITEQSNQLNNKFSFQQLKSKNKTSITQNQSIIINKPYKKQQNSIRQKNKDYLYENLLLDNTGSNSNFLDLTEKSSI